MACGATIESGRMNRQQPMIWVVCADETQHITPILRLLAVVVGSAMGSFAVEKFSVQRLLEISREDITSRVAEFRQLVAFEHEQGSAS